MPFLVPLVLVVFSWLPARAQAPADVEGRLLQDLKFLTSDLCEGRGITTKGIEPAALYIEREFIKAGLKPGGTQGYFQPFTVATGFKLGSQNHLVLQGPLGQTIDLEHGKHFRTWPHGGNGKVQSPIIFAGYGITSTDPPYDDYAGLDVAGKVVVVLNGTPRQGHPHADVFAGAEEGTHRSLQARDENARKHKAAGLLIVNPRSSAGRFGDQLPRAALSGGIGEPLGPAVVYLERAVADAMLASGGLEDLAAVEKAIDADLKPRSRPLTGWKCKLETDATLERAKVKNVIGVVAGKGPLANETVVIGAHYDHVGYLGTTRRLGIMALGTSGPGGIGGVGYPLARAQDSAIHHGADDNASGTSVVLELARHFAAQKDRQGRRLVFIAFSAEESGLLGSAHYCRQPVFPLADTVAMVNMDQVGRLQDNKLLVGGLGTAKTFPPLLDRLNKKYRFDLTREFSGTAPTDNASFNAKKIPVFWFFTGFHEQYHCPADRVETVNVSGLARIVSLIGDVVDHLGTEPSRPQWLKTEGFDRTKTLWATAPCTGIVVGFAGSGEGVIVAEVLKDTPAARAGLGKGDVLLELAGKKLSGPTDFLSLTRTLKAPGKVPVMARRDGKTRTFVLNLAGPPPGFTDPHFGIVVNLDDVKDGALVTGVLPGSPAARAGIEKGDRISVVAGQTFQNRDDYLAILRALEPGEEVALSVRRGAMQLVIRLRTVKSAE
jgi:hypothetical protein